MSMMDNEQAKVVHPFQLEVLSRESGVVMHSYEHRPKERTGDTITVTANGEPWRSFRDYTEAQKFLAGAVSGARLTRDGKADTLQ